MGVQIQRSILTSPSIPRSPVKPVWCSQRKPRLFPFPVIPTLKYVSPLFDATRSNLYLNLSIDNPVYPILSIDPPIATSFRTKRQVEVHIIDGGVSSTVMPRVRLSRKSHLDLHREVLRSSSVRMPSSPTMSIRAEPNLRPLNIAPRHGQRRIAATRSPTGPALHRPATPPALPNTSRKLPTPPPATNGTPRSPNVMEQMAGFRAEVSPARQHSPTRLSPLGQIIIPKSADSLVYADEALAASPRTVSSSLHRAWSVGNTERTLTVKPRVRDAFIVQRRHDQ